MTKSESVQARVIDGIRRGTYPVGSRLPSLRSMADELGAHTNTVAHAYRALAERGLVRPEQGRGTFVTAVPTREADVSAREEITASLSRLAEHALRAGITPEAFVALAKNAASIEATDNVGVGFVECNPYDTRELAEHIGHLLRLRVAPILVEELTNESEAWARKMDLLITTPFHIDEVEEAVRGCAHVVSVSVTPTTKTLVDFSRIPSDAHVVVVGSNERTAAQLGRLVKMHARIDPDATCLVSDPNLRDRLASADVIVDSQSIQTRVRDIAGETQRLTVHFQLEANSAEFLKARLHDLFPGMGRDLVSA